jgi:hypothetical protein
MQWTRAGGQYYDLISPKKLATLTKKNCGNFYYIGFQEESHFYIAGKWQNPAKIAIITLTI